MITLYTFGPQFGVPDPSPFCMKAEVLLRMANLPYRLDHGGYMKAPKGKLPYLDDGGITVADSTFIRLHIEQRHGFDFDRDLSASERGTAWAIEKLCEDHLYWAIIDERWRDDGNFAIGPSRYFDTIPVPLRQAIRWKSRRDTLAAERAHGMGRHAPADVALLAERGLRAIADVLGEKPFLMGATPCGADATLAGFMITTLCEHFDGPIGRSARDKPNLVAYRNRALEQWFPAYAKRA